MNEPSPQTRALLDDLRAIDEQTPSQIDHAWRRFVHRQQRKRRRIVVLGLGLTVATAAAAALLLVPSLRSTLLGQQGDPGYSEAPAQLDARSSEGTAETVTPNDTARSAPPAPAPVDAAAAIPSEPEPEAPSSSASSSEPLPRHRPRSPAGAQPATEPSADPFADDATDPVSPPPSAASIAAELSLLDRAERALREGELDRVERLLADHRARFPAGALIEERRTLARQLRVRREGGATDQEK